MIDYHIHTSRCHHATGTPQEYVAVARKKGLQEIGFADHFPLDLLDTVPRAPVTMSAKELPYYLEEIKELSAKNKDIIIRVGLEIDYIPGKTENNAGFFSNLPVDYLIGSIHFLGSWDFTHPAEKDTYLRKNLDKVYRGYFDLLTKLCRSRLFDVVGHIDVVKKFGFKPETSLDSMWRKTAKELKENSICLEVNTSGLRVPVKELYPSKGLLDYCYLEKVPVTIGSDAHSPEEVGYGINDAIDYIKKAGYKEVATFMQRKIKTLPL